RVREREKYLALTKSPTYGATNHGRDAYPLVLKNDPRFVVDFGCCRNDFIRGLRRRGVDGLGVDYAFTDADFLAPMHRVPIVDRVNVSMSKHVDIGRLVFENVMRVLGDIRCGDRYCFRCVFSIALRPSRITDYFEGLLATLRLPGLRFTEIIRVSTVELSRP